jgi:hypothetical protein
MKSLMFLWKVTADDLAVGCHTSAALDYKKLESRCEHEGLSFLTITLPQLGKAFEASLERGFWDPRQCSEFKSRGGLPLFLGGFLDRVFDRSTGRLLEQPCIDSIFAIRQLTLMFKKILLDVREDRKRDAMQKFVQVEEEVSKWDWNTSDQIERFDRIVLLLWADVLSAVDKDVYNGELFPKHGPGATADKLFGNEKYRQVEWPLRLQDVFSYVEYVLPNLRYALEVDRVSFLEPGAERPVRVTAVPKTLKSQRIIAIEPTCMQFMQQAVKNVMVQKLESRCIAGEARQNVAESFVGFTSQDPNRAMAEKGSRDGSLATLDMSEASDRVNNKHVVQLLSRWPHVSAAVQACRSTKAYVPGEGEITLSKFASMGSALTFPLEAMVFTTVIFMGIERVLNRRLTRKDLISLAGKVRVYGDDIVVPVEYVSSVIEELESFGFKINSSKSFWNGKFRESCGGDFYDGHWVTPVYVRRVLPRSLRDVSEIESLVSLRNQMYFSGLWRVARHLDSIVEKVLPHYPIVEPSSTILGRHSYLPYKGEKISSATHAPLVKGCIAKYRLDPSPLDGFDALYKCLAKPDAESDSLSYLYPKAVDAKHLERSGRGRPVGIKVVWRPPF